MPSESVLRNAENSSVGGNGNSRAEGGISDAREAEGNFVNSVSGTSPSPKKVKGKGKLGEKGPLLLIVGLILGFAVLIFGAQTMMPFAVVNRLIEEFNTNGVSSVLRSDNLLDLQLSMHDGNIGLSSAQIESLEENGFYVGDYAGTKTLTYKKRNGKYQTVVSTSVNAGVDPANSIMSSLPEGNAAVFMSPAVIDVVAAFKDSEFKNAYTTASKTWRGGNSGWFDQLADLSEQVHEYSRSRWFNYAAKTANSTVQNVFREIAKSAVSSASAGNFGVELESHTTQTGTNEDGTPILETTTTSHDTSGTRTSTDRAQAIASTAATFVNAASNVANIGCAAVEGFLAVQTMVTTYQRLQKLNLVSGYMEAVQKVQAGDGQDSPMAEYNNRLTTSDEETGKTAMSSAGMSALFSGTTINPDDPSAMSVNSEKALTRISEDQDGSITAGSGLTGSLMREFTNIIGSGRGLAQAFTVCNYLNGGLALLNAAITIVSVIPIVGQGIKLLQISFKAVARAAAKAAIAAIAPIIARKVIELLGNFLIKDIATDWLGEDLGNALVSGGNSLLSANHQTGGGSPASHAKLAQFKRLQNEVIAAEGEYQRQTRSPFDISSQYTFLGSMVYGLVPMANSSGVGSIMKTFGNFVRSSMINVLPTASAIAETDLIGVSTKNDCPTLGYVDIAGDAYCNPMYITDTSTITISGYENIWTDPTRFDSVVAANGGYYGSVGGATPEEIVETEKRWGDIRETSEGVYEIVEDSNLAKYAMYCGQRNSSWGTVDANINSSLQGNGVGKKILSAIPIVGDAMTIVQSVQNEQNLEWTTGKICVASETNEYWCEMSVHQRFIEDERWRNGIGVTSTTPVTAYLEDYYDQNPLDNSYEGILARYSGMTKEDVIATLDLIEGLNYIAKYNPAERLAFGGLDEKTEIHFEETESSSEIALEPKYIIYTDIRNRVAVI